MQVVLVVVSGPADPMDHTDPMAQGHMVLGVRHGVLEALVAQLANGMPVQELQIQVVVVAEQEAHIKPTLVVRV